MRRSATGASRRAGRLHPVRIEAWRSGRTSVVVVGVGGKRNAVMRALRHDAATNSWMHAEAALPVRLPDASVAPCGEGLPWVEATTSQVADFSVGGKGTIPAYLALGACGLPPGLGLPRRSGDGERPPSPLPPARGRRPFGYDEGLLPPTPPGFAPDHVDYRVSEPPALWDAYARDPDASVFDLPYDPEDNRSCILALADIAARYEGIARHVLDGLRLEEAVSRSGRHWSPRFDAWLSPSSPAHRRRRQACDLQPAFAPSFPFLPEVARRIDAGRPFEGRLAEDVAGIYGARPEDVRSLMKPLRYMGLPDRAWLLHATLELALSLPRRLLPTTKDGWRRFPVTDLARTCAATGLDPADLASDVGKPGADNAFPAIDGMQDMARWCSETLVTPLTGVAGEDADTAAFRLLFAGMGVKAASAKAETWHRRIGDFQLDLPLGFSDLSWPPLFAPRRYGDVEVRCLSSAEELRSEGAKEAMNHCVAVYVHSCHGGHSHVLSLRDGAGARLSTAQLVGGGRAPYEVAQHKGRGNAEPPPAARRALDRLLADLAAGKVRTKARSPSPVDYVTALRLVGPDAEAVALSTWAPWLRYGLGRLDPAGASRAMTDLLERLDEPRSRTSRSEAL